MSSEVQGHLEGSDCGFSGRVWQGQVSLSFLCLFLSSFFPLCVYVFMYVHLCVYMHVYAEARGQISGAFLDGSLLYHYFLRHDLSLNLEL